MHQDLQKQTASFLMFYSHIVPLFYNKLETLRVFYFANKAT
jgi:hypothetical protein